MIYIVLGMHKSGTTLISKMLHESGINMGYFDKTVGYDQGNQYERKTFQDINFKLLKCRERHSLDVISTKFNIDNKISKEAYQIIKNLDKNYNDWGQKEPRTVLTYSVFWEPILPDHRLIIVFRNPVELLNHYMKYIPKYKMLKRLRTNYKTLKAWWIYNNELIKILNSTGKEYVVIDYSKFMNNDDNMRNLNAFTGIQLKDARDKSMYRSKKKHIIKYFFIKFILLIQGYKINDIHQKLLKFQENQVV